MGQPSSSGRHTDNLSGSVDSRVCYADELYRSGKTSELAAELKDLTSWRTDLNSAVRLQILKGMALFDTGDVTGSISALIEAEELSRGASAELQFAAAFALFLRRSDFQTPDEVVQGLTRLRQIATTAGGGHALAGLYLAVARLDGHRGLCTDAHAHLESARKFAALATDFALECSLDLIEAGLESIAGNISRSRQLAEKCYEAAGASGFVKYQVGAATTLALLSLYAGQPKRARHLVRRVLAQAGGLTYVQLGALDTLAQVELRDGDLGAAHGLLERCQTSIGRDRLPARSWYDLAHQVTRCTYYELLEDWHTVVAIVDDADPELARRQFKAVRTALLGAKARALAHLGRHADADQTLARAVRTCPRGAVDPLIGLEASKAVCATLRGNTATGAVLFDRALAACRSIGHQYHEWWIDRARQAVAPAAVAAATAAPRERDVTDTALLLSDVATILGAGHSIDLLAHRVTAILQGTTMGPRVQVQSESGLPYDPTPSASWEAASQNGDEGTFRIRLRGSDRQVVVAVRGVQSIDEISLLKAVADVVHAAVRRTADSDADDEDQNLWPRTLMQAGDNTVFRSPRMIELLRIAGRLAETRYPILITGETGTGKEVIARLIHEHSKVRRGPFLPFNCSAVPRELVESQLFGHRRGAFTGATDAAEGVIRAAEGGTLFLDEIGDLDTAVQPKLLRFLESGEILPVGESRPVNVNVRVVAATNADLDARAGQGLFRSDLLYRINGAKISLPPLRERKDEIPALASLFVSQFSRECERAGLRVGDDLIAALLLYDWPGNIRQLANEIRRVVAMAVDGQTLSSADLASDITRAWYARPTAAPEPERNAVHVTFDQPLPRAVETVERAFIEHALARSRGRVTEAAQLLGLSRKGLFLKRRRHGLGDN
jgi:DNA-binding NtrC family response regulator